MRHGLTKEFYDHIVDYRDHPGLYSEREQLAIEYAERFVVDHHNIGPAFFDRLRKHYDEGEILELTLVIARHMAFGRLTKVLHLEDACMLNVEGDFDFPGSGANEGAYDF